MTWLWRREAPAQLPSGTDADLVGVPGDDRKHALVVEDYAELAELESTVLRSLGYTVTVAADVDDAIIFFDDVRPSLVILDLRLGAADGLNLLSFIRRTSGILPPVLVVSGHIGDDVIAYVETVDNVAVLPKKDIADLARAVEQLCESAASQAPLPR